MFIKSKCAGNPVLLWLHGGPGMPDYFLTQRYPTGLEEYFTVVWWEQRGTGLSYNADIPPQTMTVEQFVTSSVSVTNYLRKRFDKEKIYPSWALLGKLHWYTSRCAGTDDHAYIGMAQLVYQLKSETLAYEYMLQRFKESGNRSLVRRLESAPVQHGGRYTRGVPVRA